MKKIIFGVLFVLLASYGTAEAGNCRMASGKAYYTDGVSNFYDAKCQQEMMGAEADSGTVSGVNTGAVAGSGNCKYNTARKQYSDGVSFFTDSKCLKEAVNGETATLTEATVTQTPVQTQTAAVSSGQYTVLAQKIDNLDKRMTVVQSILAQILTLLAKK